MENLAINARKKITMDKYFSQVKIVVPNNIKSVVNVGVRSDILTNEITNNFLVVTGKLTVEAVYISEENNVESVTNVIDFVERQKASFVLTDLCANDNVVVQKISYQNSEIVCSVEHETEVYGVLKYMVGKFVENDSEFVLNKKQIDCVNFISAGEDRFVVAEIVDSNLGDVTVLSNSTRIVITEIASAVEKIVIDGKVVVNTLYKDEQGTGECQKEIEFRQEIAVKSAMPGMPTNAIIRVTNISVVPENRDDKFVMNYIIDIYAKAYLYENISVMSYDDIFSLKNELVPTYDYLELETDDGYKYDTDMVLMQTDVSTVSDFDDIVGVYMPRFESLSFEDKGERVIIQSKISAIAIYKTSKGLEKLDLNYNVNFDTDKDISKTLQRIVPTISISSFKVKAGKDLETSFSLGYKILYEKKQCEKYVKSYEFAGEKIADDSAVKVYIVNGEKSVFEVAKALGVKPEVILEQNEVDDTFESGQKVYIYSPLNV